MSDRRKEAEEKMAKAIFISADCWLKVFELLSSRQLGFGISMISLRFDFYVDEHFKTRRWALKSMEIRSKIGKNGTKEMKIINSHGKPMPIPQIQLPRKVIGFEWITINYIDQNSIALKFDLNEMSDRPKEAEEKMAKAIFISADCWLSVFDLLPLSQLGLGIALISHRFNYYVDEHFKTRKWALKFI